MLAAACLLNSDCQLLLLPVRCCNVAACVRPQEKSSAAYTVQCRHPAWHVHCAGMSLTATRRAHAKQLA